MRFFGGGPFRWNIIQSKSRSKNIWRVPVNSMDMAVPRLWKEAFYGLLVISFNVVEETEFISISVTFKKSFEIGGTAERWTRYLSRFTWIWIGWWSFFWDHFFRPKFPHRPDPRCILAAPMVSSCKNCSSASSARNSSSLFICLLFLVNPLNSPHAPPHQVNAIVSTAAFRILGKCAQKYKSTSLFLRRDTVFFRKRNPESVLAARWL